MNFDDYQAAAARTINDNTSIRDDLANFALGLAGEAGEVTEPIKKHLFHGKPLDTNKLAAELGDVIWYIAAICETLGLSLNAIAADNVAKLEARYPAGFVKGGGSR